MRRRAESFAEWKAVMGKIRARLKGPLFHLSRTISGSSAVGSQDVVRACCGHMATMADRSYGPRKIRQHLSTVIHFQNWCLDRPVEVVLARFPEVKVLLAERELVKREERQVPSGGGGGGGGGAGGLVVVISGGAGGKGMTVTASGGSGGKGKSR